jgi:hypothetical protein
MGKPMSFQPGIKPPVNLNKELILDRLRFELTRWRVQGEGQSSEDFEKGKIECQGFIKAMELIEKMTPSSCSGAINIE